ncbi:MAG: metal-dependent transcriptional regulator [Thermofilum sp.]
MPVRGEDYLALLYRLKELGVEARLSVISRELGVRAPSALRELSRLESRGLVSKSKPIYFLTEAGLEVAEQVVLRHRVLERFLADVLKADPYRAHSIAHQLEHAVEFAELVDAHIGSPSFCPHGNPVPGRASTKVVPLTEAGVGMHRLARIGELKASLEWVRTLKLQPGRPIAVKKVERGGVVVEWSGGTYTLPLPAARLLFVEKR